MHKIINENKNLIITLLIALFFGGIITLSMMNSRTLNYDIIWGFHITQKVSNGNIMYTEVNQVLAPIYYWIAALFSKIFGNSIASGYILSGVLGGTLLTVLYNILKKINNGKYSEKILFLIFSTFSFQFIYTLALPNYNVMAIMWWIISIFLELKSIEELDDKKKMKNNILIGILLALSGFTKQNIGVFAVLSSFGISIFNKIFDKQNFNLLKDLLSKVLGLLIVIFGMLVYFILTDSFYPFISFCIGGLFEFESKNSLMKLPTVYLFVIPLIILSFAISCKTKDKKLSIITLFQLFILGISYPISNTMHVNLSIISVVCLVIGLLKYLKKMHIANLILIIFLFVMLFIPMPTTMRELSNFEKMMTGEFLYASEIILISKYLCFVTLTVLLLLKKDNFSKVISWAIILFALLSQSIIRLEITQNDQTPEGLEIYKNLGIPDETLEYIKNIIEYIKLREEEGKNVIVVSIDAAYYMATLERNNWIYDFPICGCLGYEGEDSLINELKIDENSVLLKNKQMMYQESKKFDQYIKNICIKTDEIKDLEVFELK